MAKTLYAGDSSLAGAASYLGGVMAHAVGQVEEVREDHLGYGAGAVGRHVGHHDSPPGRGLSRIRP